MDYNSTPNTDTVVKKDVRYFIALYLSIEAMFLTNWFMYGKDAMQYYMPDGEKEFNYKLKPEDDDDE